MIQEPQTFAELVGVILNIISLVIPVIFAITLLVIIWRVIDTWIIHGGEPDKIEEGRQTVIIGIVVLVVMSGIWGILALLRSSLFGI